MDDQAVHNSVQTIPLVDDAGVVTNERAEKEEQANLCIQL